MVLMLNRRSISTSTSTSTSNNMCKATGTWCITKQHPALCGQGRLYLTMWERCNWGKKEIDATLAICQGYTENAPNIIEMCQDCVVEESKTPQDFEMHLREGIDRWGGALQSALPPHPVFTVDELNSKKEPSVDFLRRLAEAQKPPAKKVEKVMQDYYAAAFRRARLALANRVMGEDVADTPVSSVEEDDEGGAGPSTRGHISG